MASIKPRILILTDWFIPGYKAGGPIQSVNNLVQALQSEVDFSIITGDRDLLSDHPYEGVEINSWKNFESHRRYYASADQLKVLLAEELADDQYDFIYLNSFFSTQFTIKPLLRIRSLGKLDKVILAPRGMLGKGALHIKFIKKQLFLLLFRILGFHKRIHFHSTDSSEYNDIRATLGHNIKNSTLPNFPTQSKSQSKSARFGGITRFIYASRISPKKNTLFILEILRKLNTKFQLDIYGAADDQDYLEKCKRIINLSQNITYHEAITPNELMGEMNKADFFILPTQNENFGHAIIESLAQGTPVIISDQTPWNDIEEFGAGWVIPLQSYERWKDSIRLATELSDSKYAEMSQRAIEYVKTKFDFNDLRKQYLNLFRAANRPE